MVFGPAIRDNQFKHQALEFGTGQEWSSDGSKEAAPGESPHLDCPVETEWRDEIRDADALADSSLWVGRFIRPASSGYIRQCQDAIAFSTNGASGAIPVVGTGESKLLFIIQIKWLNDDWLSN